MAVARRRGACLFALILLSWCAAPTLATGEMGDGRASDAPVIRNVRVGPDGAVSGEVYNPLAATVQDLRLVVRHAWLWNSERHPGEDSPGQTVFVRIPTTLAAGAVVRFDYIPTPPLPARKDGRFETAVEVATFTVIE